MAESRDKMYFGKFPDDFMWSTATASYQIEGAWNEGGRGLSIWDTFSHTEGNVLNNENGDVACDSYHKYEEDVQLMKNLGVTHYRFSISWSRILPDGTTSTINEEGVEYYSKLLDCLKAAGIKAVATLYHWDLPQTLQDQGGWTNDDILQHFTEYARVCFQKFGDRVSHWITLNEPSVAVWLGHGVGEHAPGIKDPLETVFKVAHNMIRAHARVYHLYDQHFRSQHKGQIGITLNMEWNEPKDASNRDDCEASELMMQVKLGWYANPIWGDGDYPQIFKTMVDLICRGTGYPQSNLPTFTEEEKKLNKGTSDFFGLNYYTTRLVSKLSEEELSKPMDMEHLDEGRVFGVKLETDPSWKRGESAWLYIVPWGLRNLINWIKKSYANPPIYITENGVSDGTGDLDDKLRIDYIKHHINNVLKAVLLDECNVIGYTLWSLLDNFEWARGYSEHFGLHNVDFNDPKRPRKAKASVEYYKKIIKDNGFPPV